MPLVTFEWPQLLPVSGAVGLCFAVLFPVPSSRSLYLAICAALVAGMLAMATWSLLIIYSTIADMPAALTRLKEAGAEQTIPEYLRDVVLGWWLFVCPVAVALHFVFSNFPVRASNKSYMDSSRK
jgi:hypothetical protein